MLLSSDSHILSTTATMKDFEELKREDGSAASDIRRTLIALELSEIEWIQGIGMGKQIIYNII